MNIFFVHESPLTAAKSLGDKHVVKMVLETAQLLCGARRMMGHHENIMYHLTHENHPCAIWARESSENYVWLYRHFLYLSNVYKHRYGKIHASWTKLGVILADNPLNESKGKMTLPPSCMPEYCKIHKNPSHLDEVVINYRNYYRLEKKHLHNWKNRTPPDWI